MTSMSQTNICATTAKNYSVVLEVDMKTTFRLRFVRAYRQLAMFGFTVTGQKVTRQLAQYMYLYQEYITPGGYLEKRSCQLFYYCVYSCLYMYRTPRSAVMSVPQNYLNSPRQKVYPLSRHTCICRARWSLFDFSRSFVFLKRWP